MKWEKLSHLEHVLKRPDSYVGSVKCDHESSWVKTDEGFVTKKLFYAPALLKIFDEILVNALDQNALHPTKTTAIDVEVDKEEGIISVRNNGIGIPVEKHDKENVYIPELIFGTLLTSSNYDDSEQRTTGGRNGYGAKLTNIYSSKFALTVKDPTNKLEMSWVWQKNMQKCTATAPKKYSGKDGEVKITFEPDWKRFGMTGMSDDVYKLFEKRVWDASVCSNGLKVTFQGQRIPVKNLGEYAAMHDGAENTVAYSDPNGNWDVVIAPSNYAGFQQVSFVNGICTTQGGTHVEYVANMLSKGIIQELVKKKIDGASKLRPMNVKAAMFMFVRSTIVNPSFSSQIKSECTSKSSEFGSTFTYPEKFMKTILSSGIQDELTSVAKFKEQKELKKSDGAKKTKLLGIPKLDDANWAGTSKSAKCTLIITEGDSAKALAISGLSVVGRDSYGVFPLRGKPRNVRDASVKQLMDNKEFSDLKKIIGLQQEKDYKSLSDLRYGKLMIMTDADLDGSHIKGLVLNMFECFWPSLIKLGFVVSMVTPIIKVGKLSFFTNQTYEAWLREQGGQVPRNMKVKYYKGLGTSTSTEAKEYFKEIDKLTVGFTDSNTTKKYINLAFEKTQADARKNWLESQIKHPKPEVPYGDVKELSVSDFINRDLVNFSIADVKRSIPHLCDGLKPSQRKVLFGCLKRKLTGEIKVAQLCGYVSEAAAYHHGETSLQGAIVGMAHNYMGSNNINLLEPCGQFGTRLMGGKDAASARYIFTKLSKNTTDLFHPDDNPTLKYLDDDGKRVEPEYYIPTIPMILVNGGEGIGTGYSTTVPSFNPDDIKENIRRMIRGENVKSMTPWVRGFTGKVVKKSDDTWEFQGAYKLHPKKIDGHIITELPPGKWTQPYKEFLDGLVDKEKITSYENHSTEDKVKFVVEGYNGSNFSKDLGLTRQVHTTNMWLMTPSGMKKYDTAEDILSDYFTIRMKHYNDRKKHLLVQLKSLATVASEKARFVEMVVSENIKIFRQTRTFIEEQLSKHKFVRVDGTWDYLLNIKTHQYTVEAIERHTQDAREKKEAYTVIKNTTPQTMWENDLKI